VADADGWGFAEQPERVGEPQPRIFTSFRYDTQRRDPHAAHPDHWAAEPAVGRVAHGIPNRVDRLRGLGNAVVPQVAEHIGRLIMATDAA
jgi:hypothetical protein